MEALSKDRDVWVAGGLALFTLLLFYFSIKATQQHFDYTARIASALLQGDVGLRKPAPSWLNEMVPANGNYYSVFPLGAVLSMMPVAVLQKIKLVHDFPGHALAALIAALSVWFLFGLSVIGTKSLLQQSREKSRVFIYFLIVPVALGLFTALYNYARFHSIFDFGYSHIPNVLQEPWYQHGLFSFYAIPWNINKMLFEGFRDAPNFPFISFYPFGCSIFLASPFLFLLFREGGPHKTAAWVAIGLLTFALWAHGNPGGWQFSYRYAMVLLPWMFLLLLGNGPAKISIIELSLFIASITINALATYQFLWTDQIHP